MKKVCKLTALLLCAVLLFSGLASAITVVDPTADFYVADYANVLSDETEKYIIDMNRTLEEKTGGQVVVVTIEFLGGQPIEEYAYTLMNEWKIGSSELNNGLLLLLVTGEANYWAMSGSGIQISLTASLLAEYLNTYLEPDFSAQNYDAGVTKTFDQFLGWYERFYKVDLDTDNAQGTQGSIAEPETESESPLEESHAIQKGGIVGKIAGWFLVIVLVLAVVAVILVAVPRMIYLRRRGYHPNILSRTFWSSNPPPPPSRSRTTVSRPASTRMGTGGTGRTGSTPPRTMPRMGSGGSVNRSGNTRSYQGPRTVGGSRPSGVSRPSVTRSRPASGGGGSTRGGGAGRSSR